MISPFFSGKMTISLKVLVFVLMTTTTNASMTHECNTSTITNCPFYAFKSDLVTLQDMQEQNITGINWVMIYYSGFDTYHGYSKCSFRWNRPGSDNIIHRESMCYHFDMDGCENFESRVKRKEDSCGRVEENSVNATPWDSKFYSQDLSQYIWFESCVKYSVSGKCDEHYIDLLVKDTRDPDDQTQELDLQGLPWHLISADLKNGFKMDFSSIQMKYSWKGPECGFDGKLKTTRSSALQRGANYFVLFFIVAFTFFF